MNRANVFVQIDLSQMNKQTGNLTLKNMMPQVSLENRMEHKCSAFHKN